MANPRSGKVTLSADATVMIEQALRQALVNASSTNVVPNLSTANAPTVGVTLDPGTVARFTEHLRKCLVKSESTNVAEAEMADAATQKVR